MRTACTGSLLLASRSWANVSPRLGHPALNPRCAKRRSGSSRQWLPRRGGGDEDGDGLEHTVGRGRREQAGRLWQRRTGAILRRPPARGMGRSEPVDLRTARTRGGGRSDAARARWRGEGSTGFLPPRRRKLSSDDGTPPHLLGRLVRSSAGRRRSAIERLEAHSSTARAAVSISFKSLVAHLGACAHSEGGGR